MPPLSSARRQKPLPRRLGAEPAAAALWAKTISIAKEVAKYIPDRVLGDRRQRWKATRADGYTQAIKAVVDAQDVKGVLIAHSL